MSGELGAEALEALQGADHMGTCSFQSILGHVGDVFLPTRYNGSSGDAPRPACFGERNGLKRTRPHMTDPHDPLIERISMIKDIVKDRDFLSKPAEPATPRTRRWQKTCATPLSRSRIACAWLRTRLGRIRRSSRTRTTAALPSCSIPRSRWRRSPIRRRKAVLSLEEVSEVKRFQMISVGYQVISNGNL